MAVRDREREGRLMSIDAVATAISHEVGQPLSAVNTNAMLGLNWLTRPTASMSRFHNSTRPLSGTGVGAPAIISRVSSAAVAAAVAAA